MLSLLSTILSDYELESIYKLKNLPIT